MWWFSKPKKVMMWKHVGETPLAALSRLRQERPHLIHEKLTYAGRLDPMAEGRLLVLVGDECKQRENYLGLDKTYDVEILFGVESDTGDVLGVVNKGKVTRPQKKQIQKVLANLVGDVEMPYPIFSSKTVWGKPLFLWALEGRIDEIQIPVRRSHIYWAKVRAVRVMRTDKLFAVVCDKIARLPHVHEEGKELGRDFRRNEVLTSWKAVAACGTDGYTVARIIVHCSSGTYMRSLAAVLGRQLGTAGLALSIKRTHIGS